MSRLYRRKPDGPWWADYVDATGTRQRVSTKTTNKLAAQRILSQLTVEAATGKFNVSMASSTNLSTLIDEYIAYLGRSGDDHQATTEHRIRRVIDAAGWTQAKQITQYKVETIVQQLHNERPSKSHELISLRTQSHYLTSLKSFTKWLTLVRKAIHVDPLAPVKKPNFQTDRKLIRRFLTRDEWYWLAKTPNATLYATAIQTGFRASELLSIVPAHIKPDHIALPARATKNGQAAKQYITPELYEQLREHVPFRVPSNDRLAELLREDLQLARQLALEFGPLPRGFLEPLDAEEKTLDFHSLRHTCGAWLAIAGTNPKTIQSVMRHSTITLTFDTYGHLMPGAEAEAASTLGQLLFDVP